MTALDYLRDLVDLTGVSGAEEDVVRHIADLARPLASSVEIDPWGNVLAVREGTSPDARRCLIAAHMDEIGFRVRKIESDGFLRFEKLGGSDNRILLGQRVWLRTPTGRIVGVIGSKSAHLLSESDRTSVPPHEEMYIDIGARDATEVERMGVRLGTPVGFTGELTELGRDSGRYTAHALDDRVGCAVLLALLEALRDDPPDATVIAAFTVQEEVGLRGAAAVASGQAYDVGLAVDTTAVDDTPELRNGHLVLGAGPAVKIMDFSLISHPAVQRGLEAACRQAGIEYQHEILMRIGTDAGALQSGGSGLPAGTLSVGTRYTHTPVEVLHERDLEGAVQVLREFVRALPGMNLGFLGGE